MKKTTALTLNGVAVAAIGVACIIGGLRSRSANTNIRRMFQSGHWSVATVTEKTGIQTEANLDTPRERALFWALSRTNEQCVGLAALGIEVSNGFLLMGACLLFMGGRTAWLAIRIMKECAEPGVRR